MKIVVQKFGGTSVSTHEKRKMVIDKVSKAKEEGFCPVVVVSAMGRYGEPYATDTLLSLLSKNFCNENKLAIDSLISCGEIISTVIMSYEFSKRNIKTIPLSGGQAGIITDENYNNANVIKMEIDNIMDFIKKDKIPIVAGFQGISEKGFVTTLGRGGSDVTAALLGVALKAEKVEIYTDVDGIMTADPRIVSEASLIKEISYNEVFQFADQGAKVIHPRAVDIAMKGNIPLVIKNTLSNSNGTLINSIGDLATSNVITGITSMHERTQIIIEYSDNKNYENIFDILAENSISIDLINIFPKQKIFTIDENCFDKFNLIMKSLNLKFLYTANCSKIAIIGSRMRGIPGVMARILKALTKNNIEILQTADSHTTIWCLVKSEDEVKAINSLHKEFKLG